jgi:hypothetical protein
LQEQTDIAELLPIIVIALRLESLDIMQARPFMITIVKEKYIIGTVRLASIMLCM